MVLEIDEIMRILPHRYPFLLIDRVVELEEGKRVVAIKNVSMNEEFFTGHFPQLPVTPGVLIVEASAQAAIILFYYSKLKDKDPKGIIYYLGKVTARFFKPVVPGDQMRIEVTPVKLMAKLGIVKAEVQIAGEKAAEVEIVFSVDVK